MDTYKRSSRRQGEEESSRGDAGRGAMSFFQGELFKQWILPILITIVSVVIFRLFFVDLIFVDGDSMRETLFTRDLMVVTKIERLFVKPSRGSVVVCKYPDSSDLYVKRVIGVGGDNIMIRNGVTYINGEEVDEPYIEHHSYDNFGPFEIPQDNVMVMGDNRSNSLDSRASNVGPLPVTSIVGYARAVLLPFSHFGKID